MYLIEQLLIGSLYWVFLCGSVLCRLHMPSALGEKVWFQLDVVNKSFPGCDGSYHFGNGCG